MAELTVEATRLAVASLEVSKSMASIIETFRSAISRWTTFETVNALVAPSNPNPYWDMHSNICHSFARK